MEMEHRKGAREPSETRSRVRGSGHGVGRSSRADDSDRARGEERFVTIGLAADRSLLVVVWSPGGLGGRILSARRATRRERRNYEEEP